MRFWSPPRFTAQWSGVGSYSGAVSGVGDVDSVSVSGDG